jgi:hypothetical protein
MALTVECQMKWMSNVFRLARDLDGKTPAARCAVIKAAREGWPFPAPAGEAAIDFGRWVDNQAHALRRFMQGEAHAARAYMNADRAALLSAVFGDAWLAEVLGLAPGDVAFLSLRPAGGAASRVGAARRPRRVGASGGGSARRAAPRRRGAPPRAPRAAALLVCNVPPPPPLNGCGTPSFSVKFSNLETKGQLLASE